MKPKFEPLKCAYSKCHMHLIQAKSVDMIQVPPQLGDLIVCGGCGSINEVTLLGTKLISKEDFEKLKVEEKADLNFAGRAITPKGRNE